MTTAISPRLAAAPVALALLLAPLSACASTPPASESMATTPSEAATAAEAPASAAPTTAPAGTSSATSDVCAVLSEEEVNGVIGPATVDANLTFVLYLVTVVLVLVLQNNRKMMGILIPTVIVAVGYLGGLYKT